MKKIISVILAIAFLLCSCYSEADLEQAREEAYNSGFDEGSSEAYDKGYDEGYQAGFDEGLDSGYQSGEADGYSAGEKSGYNEGYRDGYAAGKENASKKSSSSGAGSTYSSSQPNATAFNYILNRNTKKFHYPSCSSVGQMKESNKIYFTGTRTEAISKGYAPCQRCKP